MATFRSHEPTNYHGNCLHTSLSNITPSFFVETDSCFLQQLLRCPLNINSCGEVWGKTLDISKLKQKRKVTQNQKYFTFVLFLKAEDHFATRNWPIPDGNPSLGGRWCVLKTEPVSLVVSLVHS